MGDAERYRLQAMSLSADGDGEADDETSMEGEQARLACQFVLGEDDDGHEFVVTFASGLGNS
ncbi:MAG: hypothetical protein IPM60_04955 [Rhodospirillales bacterium]|nr:hypothetical protein [Rhodospirillales bacterium]